MRYLTIMKFAAESGYTEDAVRNKIKNGVWLEQVVWLKAPDGRILIDVKGYMAWVQGNQAFALQAKAALKLNSCTRAHVSRSG